MNNEKETKNEKPISAIPLSVFLSYTWAPFIPIQGALLPFVLELNKKLPPETVNTLAIGLYASSFIWNSYMEAKALEKGKISPNILTNVFYQKTSAFKAAVAARILTTAISLTNNPVETIGWGSLLFGRNDIFIANLQAGAITSTVYTAAISKIIYDGKLNNLIEFVEPKVRKVLETAGIIYERTGLKKVDEWMFPAQEVIYPDSPPIGPNDRPPTKEDIAFTHRTF